MKIVTTKDQTVSGTEANTVVALAVVGSVAVVAGAVVGSVKLMDRYVGAVVSGSWKKF